MNAIRLETMVDESLTKVLPGLGPMLGKQIELIARESASVPTARPRLSIDELLAARLTPPPGVGPLSVDDIDRAIAAAVRERAGV